MRQKNRGTSATSCQPCTLRTYWEMLKKCTSLQKGRICEHVSANWQLGNVEKMRRVKRLVAQSLSLVALPPIPIGIDCLPALSDSHCAQENHRMCQWKVARHP